MSSAAQGAGASASTIASAPPPDPARQAKARAFASRRRGLAYAETLLLAVFAVLWISTGISDLIALPLRYFGAPWWATVLAESTAFALPGLIITLPFRYLAAYALPRHFGLLTQSPQAWAADLLKELALFAAMGLPALWILYALLRYAPERWWLWASFGYTIGVIIFAAVLPVVLLPMFYRVRPIGAEYADLVTRLIALAESARTRIRGVFSLELSSRTPAANAFLIGLGRTRSILLSDTLLAGFSREEIETVIAHELAHQAHRDIPVGIAVQAVLSLAAFRVADLAIRAYTTNLHLKSMADPAALPVHVMILGVAFFLTSPFANAYSRWRESRADTYALRLTRKPEAFVSAMTRFANLNLAVASPSRLTSGTSSHPSLISRIRKAEAFASRLRAGSAEQSAPHPR